MSVRNRAQSAYSSTFSKNVCSLCISTPVRRGALENCRAIFVQERFWNGPDLGSRLPVQNAAMSMDRVTTCRDDSVGIGGLLVPLPRGRGPLMGTKAVFLDEGRPALGQAGSIALYTAVKKGVREKG